MIATVAGLEIPGWIHRGDAAQCLIPAPHSGNTLPQMCPKGVLQEENITHKLHVLWFGGADDYVINTQMMVVFCIGKPWGEEEEEEEEEEVMHA
jgi:hypothetical protein